MHDANETPKIPLEIVRANGSTTHQKLDDIRELVVAFGKSIGPVVEANKQSIDAVGRDVANVSKKLDRVRSAIRIGVGLVLALFIIEVARLVASTL